MVLAGCTGLALLDESESSAMAASRMAEELRAPSPSAVPEDLLASRRILRSWSNSSLRTKSLRRLRSMISLSACLESCSSVFSASGVLSNSDHCVVGLVTKRTTLDNNPLLGFSASLMLSPSVLPGVLL